MVKNQCIPGLPNMPEHKNKDIRVNTDWEQKFSAHNPWASEFVRMGVNSKQVPHALCTWALGKDVRVRFENPDTLLTVRFLQGSDVAMVKESSTIQPTMVK
jgi:hypothetical protein